MVCHIWRLVGEPFCLGIQVLIYAIHEHLEFSFLDLSFRVCTAFHTSGYDTQAIVQSNDSTEYGLFQINNKIWCKDDQNPHSRNICNVSCDSELLSTLFLCFFKTYSWDNCLFLSVKHTFGFTALASKLTVGLDNTE